MGLQNMECKDTEMNACIRRRARRKTKSSDILKGKLHTFLLFLCHGNPDMLPTISRWIRVSLFVIILVFGFIIDTVAACDVDRCERYTLYDTPEKDTLCKIYRTYLQCLERLHGCKGNIKFHSMKKILRSEMTEKSCSPVGPVFSLDNNPDLEPVETELCRYQERPVYMYKNCALFGDPHLRTFDNRHQTCKVQGAWPLVNNKHLTVQVTNDRVENSLGATATTKLTVLIKRNTICASDKYITYQADDKSLPSTFDDGRTQYKKSIDLDVKVPDEHVVITLKHIDTKIIVRRVSSYLTFAIQMPEDVLNSTDDKNLQLCVQGCPTSEIINYEEFFKNQDIRELSSIPREEALEKCQNANLSDFYLDSCVFDLMMTGNENFTTAVYLALQDALNLDGGHGGYLRNRTDLEIYENSAANSVRTCVCEKISICLLFVFLCHLVIRQVNVRT